MDFDFLDDSGALDFAPDVPKLETSMQLAKPLVKRRGNIAKREFVNGLKRQALNELIPVLPPPDTDIYVVGNGAGAEIRHGVNPLAFDFGSFLPHVVRMLGDKQCTAYVSTWTMSRIHVDVFLEMLADDRLAHLTVFTDPYFKKREAAIASTLINGLSASGKGVFMCFKNHCKIIAVQAPDGRTCVTQGSANLSAQPRCENYVLSTAPDLYQFYRDDFFMEMLKHGKS